MDKSFVRDMGPDLDDLMIVRSIVDLGRNLALDVVAEGVESPRAWHELAAAGCHYAQGYFIARPMPPGQLLRWLDQWDAHRRPALLAPLPAAT